MQNFLPVAVALHLVSAVIWVGGMFFAYMALRPAAASLLEPPQRLPLWTETFSRFFPWVWIAVILLVVTGYWMAHMLFGGIGNARMEIHLMQGFGWLMILLYMHLFFAPFRRMKRALVAQDLPAAGKALNQIRMIIGINLLLGVAVVIIASAGRYI